LSSPANPLFDPEPSSSDSQAPLPLAPEASLPALAPVPHQSAENPVWSGWDILQLAGFSLLTLLIVQLLVVLGARHFVFRHAPWVEVAGKPVLALISQLVTYVVVGLYMFLLVEGKYHARFGKAIRWNWPGAAGLNFLGIGALMISFSVLARFLPMPKTTPFDQFFETPGDAYLLAVFAITFGPLMEELFFRGFLYPVLARRTGAVPAILVTAVVFGAIHSPQYGYSWAVLIIFLVGVVLTTVRAITKSVASSFLAHVGYNAILMILAAIATGGFRHMDKASLFLFR
jgi:uncharacterized protein